MKNEKDLAIARQQISSLEANLLNLNVQRAEREGQLTKKAQDLNQKLRKNGHDSNESVKALRQQNQSLLTELEQAKTQLDKKRVQERKQVIFQHKIKQSFDRFQEERSYLKRQLETYKSSCYQIELNCKDATQKYVQLQRTLKSQRQAFDKKERQFCEQLKWMKENYSKTRDVYNQSLNTRMQNEKILQDVSKKRNQFTANENLQPDCKRKMQEKIASDDLNKKCETLRAQKQLLTQQVENLKIQLERQRSEKRNLELFLSNKIQNLEGDNQQLQQSSQAEKQQFYTCLRRLQQAKQAQRKMYEESINRLLNNIQKCQMGFNTKERRRT